MNRTSVDGHDGVGNDISDHELKVNDHHDNWLFLKLNGQIAFASKGNFKEQGQQTYGNIDEMIIELPAIDAVAQGLLKEQSHYSKIYYIENCTEQS